MKPARVTLGITVIAAVICAGCGRRTSTDDSGPPQPALQVGTSERATEAPREAAPSAFAIPDGWVVSPENDKAAGEAGHRILHEDTGIEMVYVPPGKFMMGSADDDPDAADNEKPQHEVELSGFWIGRAEVTLGQWRKVMGGVPDEGDQGDDHPVVLLTWRESQSFCDKLGLRLPSEAEWEYAARGPEGRKYPWGKEWDESKCCNGKNRGPSEESFPVGSFADSASWCGALDMAGNAWEWCADWFAKGYYGKGPKQDPPGPTEAEADVVTINPKIQSGKCRVVRGSSWEDDSPKLFRGASRFHLYPTWDHFASFGGFRVARDL